MNKTWNVDNYIITAKTDETVKNNYGISVSIHKGIELISGYYDKTGSKELDVLNEAIVSIINYEHGWEQDDFPALINKK